MSAATDHAVHLGLWPTPLQSPGGGTIHVKREDLCGFAFGGSKVRALEALLTTVTARQATTIVVGGRRDSNWVALASIAASHLGLACHAVFDDGKTNPTAMRVAKHYGATLHVGYPPGAEAVNSKITRIADEVGDGAFAIPRAGATAAGAYGYAAMAQEILDQLPARVTSLDVVVAMGSGGLAAGLLIGFTEAADHTDGRDVQVIAVPVSKSESHARDVVNDLVRAAVTEGFSRVDPESALARLRVLPRGAVRDERAAAAAIASGVLLDPVFSGPAWHSYFAHQNRSPRDAVLVASGGLPAVFDAMNGSPQ